MTEAPAGVAAVDRALSILTAFDDRKPSLSLAELAQKTGLYKSTILRLITSLEGAGYVRRLSSGQYQLGPEVLRLGSIYQHTFQLGHFLEPELERLAATTGESAAFYVRDGPDKVCLYRVNATQHVVLRYIQPGYRAEVELGASGKILLAFTEPDNPAFEPVRRVPLVASLTGREAGSAALACPVFGPGDSFQGALVLAGPITRFAPEDIRNLAPPLLDAAIRTTRNIGGDARPLEALTKDLPLTFV